jgi:hypothetical protein
MDLRQLQTLISEPLQQVHKRIAQVVVRLDADVEYLPEQLFTA